MAHFKLQGNGFIYLFHWIDRHHYFRISTKMKIEKKDWNKDKQRPKKVDATYNSFTITNELVRYEDALNKALNLQPDVSSETLPEFKKLFLNIISPAKSKKRKENDFLSYFEAYVKEVKAKKQTNYKGYLTCYNRLKGYFNKPKVPFSTIDMRFFKQYSQHLASENLAVNTIANQFKLLKTVMQSAFLEGLHTNEQFRHFKRKMENADTIYLNEEELEQIYNEELEGHLDIARDYFIVGAMTGLRFDDWDRVNSDAVVNGTITIRSSKTGEVSLIPVHPYVSAILKKYGGTLPHKVSNQKMNDYIKVVAMLSKIQDPVEVRITKGGVREVSKKRKFQLVTTHTARRSLATNLVLRGVSPYVVMKVTGHKSLSSFERYVRLQELEAMIELKSLSFFQ